MAVGSEHYPVPWGNNLADTGGRKNCGRWRTAPERFWSLEDRDCSGADRTDMDRWFLYRDSFLEWKYLYDDQWYSDLSEGWRYLFWVLLCSWNGCFFSIYVSKFISSVIEYCRAGRNLFLWSIYTGLLLYGIRESDQADQGTKPVEEQSVESDCAVHL